MSTIKKMILRNEKGFALIAAIIACCMLLAVGLLVINMSTGDLRSSVITVGNKKALAAVESGIHSLVMKNDSLPIVKHDILSIQATWIATNGYTMNCAAAGPTYVWNSITSGFDPNTEYAICAPSEATDGSGNQLPSIPVSGFGIDQYALAPFATSIAGRNTNYRDISGNPSSVRVDVGIGVFVSIGTGGSGTNY
jgi:hypothetical protein